MTLAGTPEFVLFTLVLMRMSGFIFLNPILGRKSIPAIFKTGLVIVLTIAVFPTAKPPDVDISNGIVYGVFLLKEFALGYVLGFVVQLFDMAVTYAGSVIDSQMGLSMSTIYDSQNGTQVALSGTILQIYYLLLFFAVNGHLALIQIIAESGRVVPYGALSFGTEASSAVLHIFVQSIVLAVKMAFPMIAFELLMEVGAGLLMRIIPQINLFVISIQLRVGLGILLMVMLISPMGDYLGALITNMLQEVQNILRTVGA